jgi:hypothetical protein
MHPSFREGFEKTADVQPHVPVWDGHKATPKTPTLPMTSLGRKRAGMQMGAFARDVKSGMGLGKGIMPKAFGALTALDVISKTQAAMAKPRGLTGIPTSFGVN